ncbi:hypothetical protein [Methylocystis iwaonis]|uniref:hypothetical protein n=1 Tax=Methylocystis iwaonis TaxID=2885079 RepID=UPI002E7ADFDF|nr:hypothetical protein [Methylocystis iwaonis]
MADKSPFAGNAYIQGSSSTSVSTSIVSEKDQVKLQPEVVGTSNEGFVIEQSRYGSGKPRRIIIKGKISSD